MKPDYLKSTLSNNANYLFQLTKKFVPWLHNAFYAIPEHLHQSRSLAVEKEILDDFNPYNTKFEGHNVYYLSVLRSPSGYLGRSVVFHKGLVFDSNFNHPFPISKTNVSLSVSFGQNPHIHSVTFSQSYEVCH